MNTIHTDLAIAGAGCGGAAAAIQAARMGAAVVLVEETPWAGGMITSAGVVAFDGNWGALTCGFYREIVREIEIHYGGAAKTETGWVTRTAFEPHIVAGIFQRLIKREELIQPFFEAHVTEVLRDNNRVTGFRFVNKAGEEFEVRARIVVDATEFGDVIDMAGIKYRFGRESRDQTGEPDAPEKADLEIQDMTYVAILKDYQKAHNRPAPPVNPSADYNPDLFRGCTAVDAHPADLKDHIHTLHTWETFIDYGKLPANKYMINWPFHANDFPDTLPAFDREKRAATFAKAKAHTLNFVHYMQTVLGHPELGIADDEFPTDDGLPFIPYVRETRRIIGDVVMIEQDVLPGEGNGIRPALRRDSIAVGDYFLDHHHARAHPGHPNYFEEKYPSNANFQVPFGVFFPKGVDGFMAVEKSISVSHIVNGCTRLQPIVLLMGQAAGAIAATALGAGVEPREVDVRDLQELLLVRGVMLYPYDDLTADDRIFVEAQKLALSGVVFDKEDFQFRKDAPMTWDQVAELLVKAEGGPIAPDKPPMDIYRDELRVLTQDIEGLDFSKDETFAQVATRATLAPVLCLALDLQPTPDVKIRFLDMPHNHWAAKWIEPLYRLNLYEGIWHVNFKPDEPVTRRELTLLLDRAFDPFRRIPLG
ncbi:MAG: FAD-dependent oxidoreductase [Candidatus Sumerlaeaceae bacterium]|nr:FAD-dependent oxidoreductase [Candidatus Sumerlaeaceae bacterium]